MDDAIKDAHDKGLITFNTMWLDRAIEKHDPKVTVDLAWSYLQTLDTLDKVLGTLHDDYHYDHKIEVNPN